MFSKMITIMVAMLLVAVFTSAAVADSQLKIIDVNAWGYGSAGGPFEVEPIDFGFTPVGLGWFGSDPDNFLTFCIEGNEYINSGYTYDVTFSNEAKYNGTGSSQIADPLDSRTAYLYTSFITGVLGDKVEAFNSSYDFIYNNPDGGTDTYGSAFQNAIWKLEEEISSVSGLAAELVAMADAAVAPGGEWEGMGLGAVKVVNLWSVGHVNDPSYAKQDQLVMESTSPPPNPVPLPAAVWAGLVLFGGIGFTRMRRHG